MDRIAVVFLLILSLTSCGEQPHRTDGHMDVKLPENYQDDQNPESVVDSLQIEDKIEDP